MFFNMINSRKIKYLEGDLSASGSLNSLLQEAISPQMFGVGESERLHLSASKLYHSTAFIVLSSY